VPKLAFPDPKERRDRLPAGGPGVVGQKGRRGADSKEVGPGCSPEAMAARCRSDGLRTWSRSGVAAMSC